MADPELDPGALAFLNLLKVSPRVKANVEGPQAAREAADANARKLAPDDIPACQTRDFSIPGPGGAIPARLYRPHHAPDARSLLIYLHGGGWTVGSIASHDPVVRQLAGAAGCAALAINYRLAPEHPFPAGLEDCEAAFAYARDHAEELGIDPDRIAMGGDSAGGNLTIALCLRARDAGGPLPRFQLLIYPATRHYADTPSMKALAEGYFLESDVMAFYAKSYAGETAYDHPLISPLLAEDLSGQPPALVVTAGFDPLRDEGRAYADRLKAAGVPASFIEFPGQIHGFVNFGRFTAEAGVALRLMGGVVKEALDERADAANR